MHGQQLDHLKFSAKRFVHEATAPVLDLDRGRTKTGQLWAYARNNRPWGGADPLTVAYVYVANRKAERLMAHLAGLTGVLQVDGYEGDRALTKGGALRLAFCWSHVRRALRLGRQGRVADRRRGADPHVALYRMEGEIAGLSSEVRRQALEGRSRPSLAALESFLGDKLALLSQKSTLTVAIPYATSRWASLTLYVEVGRVEIDSNTVERSIRLLALTRKNVLFAGSDRGDSHQAVIASLVGFCKLNVVDPQSYLCDVISPIVNGRPQSQLGELLPWAYPTIPGLKATA